MEATKIVAQSDNEVTPKKLYSFVFELVTERQVWEDTVYRQSNDMLYSILAKILGKYEEMTQKDAEKGQLVRDELDLYIKMNAIQFAKSTHTLIKLVRCVFGDLDKRRISTYTIVLRSAYAKEVKSADLATYIQKHGGIQEIKMAKGKSLTTKSKAEIMEKSLNSSMLGEVHNLEITKSLPENKPGQQVVFVATQQASGAFTLHFVTNSASAVNQALAACYAVKKAEILKKAKELDIASNDAVITDSINQAASK